jgi:hypothetical protein
MFKCQEQTIKFLGEVNRPRLIANSAAIPFTTDIQENWSTLGYPEVFYDPIALTPDSAIL